MMVSSKGSLAPYRESLAGSLLGAREAVMAPIRPILREVDLSEQQWRILRVLSDEGEMSATALASAAMLYAPSVTRILKDLEQRDLVLRQFDGSDGRRQIIAATARGRDLVLATSKRTMRVLADYAARFGAPRLDELIAELHALMESIADVEQDTFVAARA